MHLKQVLRTVFIYVFLINPAIAQESVSVEFAKTYRAYNTAYAQGNILRATELAEKAVKIAEKEFGPEHEKTAVMRVNYGHCLVLIGDMEKAEPVIKQGKEGLEKAHGKDSITLLTSYEDMAKIHASKKELDKSRIQLDKIITILSKDKEKYSLDIANYKIQQGTMDVALQNLDSAEKQYKAALNTYNTKFGESNTRSAEILALLGDIELLREKFEIAENYYKQSLTYLVENLVEDDPKVIASLSKMAKLYIAKRDPQFAQYADKVIELQKYKDGAAVPQFVMQPQYPVFKSGKKPVGWVLLEFTVLQNGRLKDIKILESLPGKLFNKVALDAAKEWRFKPKVVEGKRMVQKNTRARMVFKQDNIQVHLGEMADKI